MIEEKEDFFEDAPEEKPKKVKAPKPPKYKQDDPRYYDSDEGKWDHLVPSPYRRTPLLWIIGLGVVAVLLLVWLYSAVFSTEVQDAVEYGYVEDVRKEGKLFTTLEGVLIPYKNIKDSVRPYEGDFHFSTTIDSVGAYARALQQSGQPVALHYKVYRTRLPWHGKTKVFVTAVDTVNPLNLLPPDRRPEHP